MQHNQSQKKRPRSNKGYILALIVAATLLAAYVPSFMLPVPHAEAQNYPTYNECVATCPDPVLCAGPSYDIHGNSIFRCLNPNPIEEIKDSAGKVIQAATSPILNVVAAILVTFAAGLLGIAGVVLNIAINITVVHAADFIRSIGSITIAWELIRDVMNALFIFILLFLAITIILRVERFGGKKMLASIIVAALLINFSFFFTRVIIDASNILTYEFYKPIAAAAGGASARVNTGTSTPSETEVNIGNINLIGFSAAFMQHLRLVTLFSAEAVDFADISLVVRQLFVTIFLLIAAFVFLAVGILLEIRFVILVILLVTSPVMFLGLILPKGSEWSRKWWTPLWDQVIWAPVFMLLASLSYIIISNPTFVEKINKPDLGNLAEAFKGADLIVIAFNFIIVIGFLVAAIIIAKTMASKSAKGAVDWATKMAGKATFGTVAAVGRRTFGLAGAALRESKFAGNLAGSQNVAARMLGRGLLRTGDWTQKASFDARSTFGIPGIQMGQAKRGGYEKLLKDRRKRLDEEKKLSDAAAVERARREPVRRAKAELAEQKRLLAQTQTTSPKRLALENNVLRARLKLEQEREKYKWEQGSEKRLVDAARTVTSQEAGTIRGNIDNLVNKLVAAQQKGDTARVVELQAALDQSVNVEKKEYALAYREYRTVQAERAVMEKLQKRLSSERDLGASRLTLSGRAQRDNAREALRGKTPEAQIKEAVEKILKGEEKEKPDEKPKEEPKPDENK
ncbi:hypothetical protein L0Y40_00115 [Candidatus Wolfebacteria bacterium]|nr:hypothetical protein [Candidatus Wolfebacteria bacterium]